MDPDFYCPQAALIDEETNLRTERRLARYRAKVEAARKRQAQEAIASAMASQQRQRLWMASGALAIAALSLLWYKRHSPRRGRMRWGGGGVGVDTPRDLALDDDDDDGFDEPDEELRQVFDEAAKLARSITDGTLGHRDRLMLYGLYKQSTVGDRNEGGGAPSNLNVVAYAKYEAWGKFKGLHKQFAMRKVICIFCILAALIFRSAPYYLFAFVRVRPLPKIQYCEVVYHFCNGGESAYGNGEDGNDADVFYDESNHEDLDEDGCPINDERGGDDPSRGMVTCMGIRPSTLAGRNIEGGGESHTNRQNNGTAIMATPEARLRSAAMSNDIDALRAVVGAACDVDDADEDGQTALHYAADRGSLDCLKILIEAGANVNAVDRDGIGVLQTALCAGLDVESVRLLLVAGADPDANDDDGDSPRAWVSEEGIPAMLEMFGEYERRGLS